MKNIKILFLYILFINIIYSNSGNSNLKTGFLQNSFLTYYKEGNKEETNIQNFMQSGIPLLFFYDSQFYIIKLNQIYLFNLYKKMDREILYNPSQSKEKNDKLFLYHTNNTFIGIRYYNIYLLAGYINPYDSLKEELQKFYYQPVFPGIDLRLDFEHHIFTISPIFLYDKQQNFTKEKENYSSLMNHFYLKQEQENYKSSKSYKIHYLFHYNFFSFFMGYYFIEHYNPYSNIKNFIRLNFYEYAMSFDYDNFHILLKVNHSKGDFTISNKLYKINGYKYNLYINFDSNFFKISLDLNKTTPSKWNQIKKDWDFYGYTSIFDEFILTPQFSSTYIMTPNYEICNDNTICEGINSFDNENHFKMPANTAFLKFKILYENLEWILATGYIEKLIYKNPDFKTNIEYDTIINNSKLQNEKHSFLEPYLQFIYKDYKFYFILSYSIFYKKLPEKTIKQVSKNINLTFIYYY